MAPTVKASASPRPTAAVRMIPYRNLALLSLSAEELNDLIARELAQNLCLERASGPDPVGSAREEPLAPGPSFATHIMHQTAMIFPSGEDRSLARLYADALDDRGYCALTPDAAAKWTGQKVERCQAVLARLKELDPPGLFAADLAECLALQLKDRGLWTADHQHVLNHLTLAGSGDWQKLSAMTNLSPQRLHSIMASLRQLNPRPAQAFDAPAAVAVLPDLVAIPTGDAEWAVTLSSSVGARLTVRMPGNWQETGTAARHFWAVQRSQAQNFIHALERRAQILLRIGQLLVRDQHDFLSGGPGCLKPLTRRQIAAELGVHPSTVTRAVSGKYMVTPRGMVALADFFSSKTGSIPAIDHGPFDFSATAAVRHRLKMILQSKQGRAATDAELAQILAEQGISLARRTITKYRNSLGLLPGTVRGRAIALRGRVSRSKI